MQKYIAHFNSPTQDIPKSIFLLSVAILLFWSGFLFLKYIKTGCTLVLINGGVPAKLWAIERGYLSETKLGKYSNNWGIAFLSPFKTLLFSILFFFAGLFVLSFIFISLESV